MASNSGADWGCSNVSGLYRGETSTEVVLLVCSDKYRFELHEDLGSCSTKPEFQYNLWLLNVKLTAWQAVIKDLDNIIARALAQTIILFETVDGRIEHINPPPGSRRIEISIQQLDPAAEKIRWKYLCQNHDNEPDQGYLNLGDDDFLDLFDLQGISDAGREMLARETLHQIALTAKRSSHPPVHPIVTGYISSLPQFSDPVRKFAEAAAFPPYLRG